MPNRDCPATTGYLTLGLPRRTKIPGRRGEMRRGAQSNRDDSALKIAYQP